MIRPRPIYLILIIVLLLSIIDSTKPQYHSDDTALYQPAVIQIGVHYKARFQVPYPEFRFENGGFIFNPQSEFYFEEVVGDWNGSGFIITSDGFILTNAHITDAEYYKKFGYLFDQALQIADFFINEQAISYEQYDLFLQSYYSYLIEHGNFTLEEERIEITFGEEAFDAVKVVSGDPIGLRTSKDVALIRANSTNEYLFPTVRLGDSDKVEIGDEVTVLGFPVFYSEISEDPFEIQQVKGRIVGMKPMEEWEAFQTDADITFGYSGGPVFNSKGEVVGIATFGFISPITKMTENFLVPINIAQYLLEQESIVNTRSIIDEHYEKGLKFLWIGEYNSSIIEFTEVLKLNPLHPYAKHYLNIAKLEEEGITFSTEKTTKFLTTSKKLSTIVKTTTVTKVIYETKMKTLLSTKIQTEIQSENNMSLMYALLFFLTITSSALILMTIRRSARAR